MEITTLPRESAAHGDAEARTNGTHDQAIASGSGDRLHAALIAALDANLETLRAAARAETGLNEAVHRARKALRRARSIVDLSRELVPRADWRSSRDAFRDARRTLGAARDLAVVPDTLGQVAHEESVHAAAHAVVDANAASAPSSAMVRQALADTARAAALAIDALRPALPVTVDWSSLVDGVQAVYCAARRARRAGKVDRRQFHTWRRRGKELTYQLEFLAQLAGGGVGELCREMETAIDALGPVVDIIMVRKFVRDHRDALDRDAGRALLDVLDTKLYPAMKATRREAREMFRKKPRAFGKALRAAIESSVQPST